MYHGRSIGKIPFFIYDITAKGFVRSEKPSPLFPDQTTDRLLVAPENILINPTILRSRLNSLRRDIAKAVFIYYDATMNHVPVKS